ncbi:hypothetical protein MLD38_006777 [Melastoma candidum]|uniref:Uncharacterized protein n=1 Tax=Melastoma candidum TaxID=119954 RepID=A0ACB9RP35_9MYRT|nr:hypothetical protein MLD38_006777 [Melastoma candidum]
MIQPPPTAVAAALLPSPPPLHRLPLTLTRRSLLLTTAPSLSLVSSPSTPLPSPDTTITDRVYMDFSICPNYPRPDRTLSDDFSSLCAESLPLGRLVLGLYGRLVPLTVSNFKSVCTHPTLSYKNTLVNKIFPGQYFLAGHQGRREKGEVRVPPDLALNTETVDPRAFGLRHSKAGLVSLSLSENDDEDEIKLNPEYRNVEFLITTGPGPCPQLDSQNIVFGTVLEGLDIVTAIATIPTYQPQERIRQLNNLAEFLGDERAQNARATWNRPLKTVFISDCGELKVSKPTLTPTLP